MGRELGPLPVERHRVFKERTHGGYPWAVERLKTGTIVSVYPSQPEALAAANRMARTSTGFTLAS